MRPIRGVCGDAALAMAGTARMAARSCPLASRAERRLSGVSSFITTEFCLSGRSVNSQRRIPCAGYPEELRAAGTFGTRRVDKVSICHIPQSGGSYRTSHLAQRQSSTPLLGPFGSGR